MPRQSFAAGLLRALVFIYPAEDLVLAFCANAAVRFAEKEAAEVMRLFSPAAP